MQRLILTLLLSFIICNVNAAVIELAPAETRFVAMRADKVNARSGPNIRYPIEWIYQQQNYPVEIIAEYEQWRKIRDYDGTVTWVRKNLLTNTRYALITEPGENNIYAKPDKTSNVIAKAEDGVVGEVDKCPSKESMCLIKFDGVRGWMPREALFGVYADEVIK
jgi:SH3-like domain-containing protein